MIIQIDQSGKLEKTNVPTAIGFANGKTRAMLISASEKMKLKQYFRDSGKRKAYIYKCFAALVFLLIKDEERLDLVIIDTEYPGQEPLIKNHLLNFFKTLSRSDVDKSTFVFKSIGKASNAHKVAYDAYKGKESGEAVTADQVFDIVK